MKRIIIILILYIQNVHNQKVKSYPKKVVPFGELQVNSGQYVNPKTVINSKYTAFPHVGLKGRMSVPLSPYFPLDPVVDQKPRVKKVLLENQWQLVRPKRSATEMNGADAKDLVKENKQESRRKSHKSKSKRRPRGKGKSKSKKRGHKKGKKRGHKKVETRRVITGKDALIEDYPYVVSIQKQREHWCTGALLNPRLVITTANCLWKSKQLSQLRIRAGSRHIDRGGEMARIQEVMKHPMWGIRRGPDYDVALILMDKTIRFSDKIHSVDLPNHAMMPAFDDAWVASWGADRRDGIYDKDSHSLQVYQAQLMDKRTCNNITSRYGVFVSENFICLAQDGKRAPCTRDTGAPAVSDGVVWGLASWGIRKLCGTERFPAMFSYLASHSNLDFITNATKHLMSEKRQYPFLDKLPREYHIKQSPPP